MSQVLKVVEEGQNKLEKICEANSGDEIRLSTEELFDQLTAQVKSLKMIRDGLIQNIKCSFDDAEHCLKSSIDCMRELTLNPSVELDRNLAGNYKSVKITKQKSLKNPLEYCKKAVIDSKGNVVCFGETEEQQTSLARFKLDGNDLVAQGKNYNWNTRKDGTTLIDICMVFDKLVAIITNWKSKQWHFEFLETETFKMQAKFDFKNFISAPRDLSGVSFCISGYGKYMALLIRRGPIVEKLFIFEGTKLIRDIHLSAKAGALYHASYFLHANFFIFKATANFLCIVSFDTKYEEKTKKVFVRLESLTDIFSVVFLATNSVSCGLLCVTNNRFPPSNLKSEIYKVDLNELENGQKLEPVKIEEQNDFSQQDIKFVTALNSSLVLCRDNYEATLADTNAISGYTILKFEEK